LLFCGNSNLNEMMVGHGQGKRGERYMTGSFLFLRV
jgi:hypothetical protein